MSVSIQKKGGKAEGVTKKLVSERAERMLSRLDLAEAELSVLLTDDATIHELNRDYRNKDKPTDVLAFAMREGEAMIPAGGAGELLGDVIISLDTALRQAEERGWSALDEVTHLLAHGLLHLVGYDHQTDEEEREMNEATRKLVAVATQETPRKQAPKRSAAPAKKRAR